MLDAGRLSKEDWDDLEPRLEAAEKAAHDNFMRNPQARDLLGDGDHTPGYLLLQHLKQRKDERGVRLFRAVEMYFHELSRADIATAYLRGKEVGRAGS